MEHKKIINTFATYHRAVRRLSDFGPVRPGSAPRYLVHRPVVAKPIPEPYTGTDSGVAPVLAGPCVRLAGVQAGVAGQFPKKHRFPP
jgi:hypothetical protein